MKDHTDVVADVEELERLDAPAKKWLKRLGKALAVLTVVGAPFVIGGPGPDPDPEPVPLPPCMPAPPPTYPEFPTPCQ